MDARNRIDGEPRSVRELLHGRRYALDFYQREYAWNRKQIAELLEDLEAKFRSSYDESHERAAVEGYQQYFLGSVIISHKGTRRLIVDGQQRLTSLTLLLIHLRHLSADADGITPVTELILSERYGNRSFNLDVPDRRPVMEALFEGRDYEVAGASSSVQTVLARYNDILQMFPDTLTGQTLPYFVDWLLDNVSLIEITAYNDDDAYTIFETMNDRGLSLSPTDMLKGYLLANISDDEEKARADSAWKEGVKRLADHVGKDADADFIKAWLRARYARSIRERKKDAVPRDWDIIGTAFHKWLRDNTDEIGLTSSHEYSHFIHEDFQRFSRHYLKALDAARVLTAGWEPVYFNAHIDFTLQYPLMLAPIVPADGDNTADQKMRLVATFLDIYTARRIVNYKQTGYSAMSYTMFILAREIRGLSIPDLSAVLKKRLKDESQTLDGISSFALHQMNRPQVRYILARLTAHAEAACGVASSFADYVSGKIKKPFEIEHIWANDYPRFTEQFASPQEFAGYRNRLGGLILLPRGFNQSLGDADYGKKVGPYYGQNLLAKSLSPDCYVNNPSFLTYREQSGLPFKSYAATFDKSALDERQALYRQLAEQVWNPARLDV